MRCLQMCVRFNNSIAPIQSGLQSNDEMHDATLRVRLRGLRLARANSPRAVVASPIQSWSGTSTGLMEIAARLRIGRTPKAADPATR
jgi:hypothetical protein